MSHEYDLSQEQFDAVRQHTSAYTAVPRGRIRVFVTDRNRPDFEAAMKAQVEKATKRGKEDARARNNTAQVTTKKPGAIASAEGPATGTQEQNPYGENKPRIGGGPGPQYTGDPPDN
tara:strand:+ start:7256 stop:7606 length:351 start_codon:yes stop_codon:yes gene_type:complete